MVGARETRRNWVVPDYELSSSYDTIGRPQSSEWTSTFRADFTAKNPPPSPGRHTASCRDPRKQNDAAKFTSRFEEWRSTMRETHGVGRNGYMFMGVPSRFTPKPIPQGEPFSETTTINRQFHNGQYARPPTSLRGYWERQDEYMDKGRSKVIGKDSRRYPFCRDPERLTVSHSMHYPLHEHFPESYNPRERKHSDHVLTQRPPTESARFEGATCFQESYGRSKIGKKVPPEDHKYPAGATLFPKGSGKKPLDSCLARKDIINNIRGSLKGPSFKHQTEHQAQYYTKSVRHTEWYGSIPEDPERQGETRFYQTGAQRDPRMDP